MRKRHANLQRVTWDQAAILHMSSSQGFAQLNISPAYVRLCASKGHINPSAIGPNGAVLYLIADVTKHAATWQDHRCRTSVQ